MQHLFGRLLKGEQFVGSQVTFVVGSRGAGKNRSAKVVHAYILVASGWEL
jgi:hypothetical protein